MIKSIRRVLLVGILIITFCNNLLAQNELSVYKTLKQYNLAHWDTDDGIPVNSIIHIIQSRDGYIWFVSYGGITRFNGVEFYTFSSFDYPAVINNSYTHIFEDRSGVIWAASSGGGLSSIKGDSIIAYTTANGLPSNFIEEVTQDSQGTIWVATSNGLYSKKGETFINDNTPAPLKNIEIKSITSDENHVWVASTDSGVYKIRNGELVNRYIVKNGLTSNNINNIKAENGAIYIGTDKGLTIIEDSDIRTLTTASGLHNDFVNSTLVDNNGALWVGSYRGLCRIDGEVFSYLSPNHPLNGQDITSMTQDREGNLWLGAYRGGIFKLWDGKFTNYSNTESGSSTVHSIIQKSDSTFIVVQQKGVDILNVGSNTLKEYQVHQKLSATNLKSGMLDSKGNLWISTLDFLLKHTDTGDTFYNEDNGLIHENVRLAYEDSRGNIWVGTVNGITVISAEGMISYSTEDGLSSEYIMSFEEDADGVMWIGTRNGLNKFEDGTFEPYYAKDGMAGDFVFKTYIDNDGIMWVCGNAGLTRFKNGQFQTVGVVDGLASNTIFQILHDDEGYFWFTTNQKGITTFKVLKSELNDLCDGKIKKVNSIAYTQGDGLKSTAAISSATSLKSRAGRLYFATNEGVEMIDPSGIKLNQDKPPVVIEKILMDGEELDTTKNIVMPAGKHRIVIHFAALSYISTDNIGYKYKLEGYDEEWQGGGQERKTSYTNLPYGDYTFRVIAANSDGVWNEDGAALSFYVNPAFYETKSFLLIVLLLAIVLSILVYNLRIRSLKKSQRSLARLVEKRTHEIVQQKEEIEAQKEAIEVQQVQIEHKNDELHKINLRLEDIVEDRTQQLRQAYKELLNVNKELDTFIYRSVHDVRGPIARLQGLSHLIKLQSQDEKIHELVSLLNNTADEMNDVFYRLLNIVRLKASELKVREISIKKVIDMALKKIPDHTKADVELKINIDPEFKLFSDRDTVEIIMHHLLDNAMKFKRKGTTHKVSVNCVVRDDKSIKIEVADNGFGVKDELKNKIFDMFFVGQDVVQGSGLGLYTVRTATKILQGKIRIAKNKEGKGTTFEVILPTNIA